MLSFLKTNRLAFSEYCDVTLSCSLLAFYVDLDLNVGRYSKLVGAYGLLAFFFDKLS